MENGLTEKIGSVVSHMLADLRADLRTELCANLVALERQVGHLQHRLDVLEDRQTKSSAADCSENLGSNVVLESNGMMESNGMVDINDMNLLLHYNESTFDESNLSNEVIAAQLFPPDVKVGEARRKQKAVWMLQE